MLFRYPICFCLLFILMLTGLPACKQAQNPRFIAESDTSFSVEIRNISKKINLEPSNPELYYKRSNTFFYEQNFKQAQYDIEYALQLDSINPLYHYVHAKYLMSGDTANAKIAEQSYNKAIQLNPNFFDATMDLAKLYLAKQDYSKAQALYIKANKQEVANPGPYFYLGIIAKETGDTSKAILLFEQTLTYDSKHYDATMQLGNYYAQLDNKKALLFFDRALEINAFSDEALYAKGLYLQQHHQYKDAMKLYEAVARINPSHIFCRYNLGFIHGLFNDYSKAISFLDDAITLSPEYADAYTLRGFMKEQLKNSTGAYNDYKHAVLLDDNQDKAKAGLKRINITISMP